MNEKSERLGAQCSPELKARVDAQAAREHSSTARFIRVVMWAYLARNEPEEVAREHLEREGLPPTGRKESER